METNYGTLTYVARFTFPVYYDHCFEILYAGWLREILAIPHKNVEFDVEVTMVSTRKKGIINKGLNIYAD